MTYTELKSNVLKWLHRDDVATELDTFCLLAESSIDKDLRAKEMEKISQIDFTSAFTDLPADYLALRAFQLESRGARVPIPQYTPQQLDSYTSRSTGRSRAFAIHGDQIELRPAPSVDSPAVCELSYYARVPSLITNETNKVLTNYPTMYLAGMLFHGNKYLQDDEQAGFWSQIYNEQISTANKTSDEGRYNLPSVRHA